MNDDNGRCFVDISEDVDVKIDGPGKADIVRKQEKSGLLTVAYIPVSPGEYNVNIKYKGKHIHGSPFSAKISGMRHSC